MFVDNWLSIANIEYNTLYAKLDIGYLKTYNTLYTL